MNPCEAFEWVVSWAQCGDCGAPYWVHSHEYVRTAGYHQRSRIRHEIITKEQAFDKWTLYGGSGSAIHPDLRPRYQIMQERTVRISKFYAAAALLHSHRRGDPDRHHLQRRWS